MTESELNIILNEGENYRIEFKSKVDNSLAKEIVAFANSSGGKILIGVSDKGTIVDLKISNPLKSKIQDIVDSCTPQINSTIEVIGKVIVLEIFEGKDKPYDCSAGFFLRSGPNSQKLKRNQIIEFLQSEGKVKYDELLRADILFNESFDENLFDNFIKLSGISKGLTPVDTLHNLTAIDKKGEKIIFNNTGLAFFSKNYGSLNPSSSITCVTYKGVDRIDVLDRKDFSNDLISNINDSLDFLKRNLRLSYTISDIQREEDYEIPIIALREAVINAVVHRNYFEKGANIKIEIFDDRVEILNPGGLVKGLTEKTFGTRSVLRNPNFADLLHRAKYIERLGTGISRMKRALIERGLSHPIFEFDEFFKITFLRVPLSDLISKMNSDELLTKLLSYFELSYKIENKKRLLRLATIMLKIATDSIVQTKDLTKIIDVSNRTINTDFNYLMEIGLLKQEGDYILRKYMLSSKGEDIIYKISH